MTGDACRFMGFETFCITHQGGTSAHHHQDLGSRPLATDGLLNLAGRGRTKPSVASRLGAGSANTLRTGEQRDRSVGARAAGGRRDAIQLPNLVVSEGHLISRSTSLRAKIRPPAITQAGGCWSRSTCWIVGAAKTFRSARQPGLTP